MVVIGVYVYTAHSGYDASRSLSAADNYYNLLAQGFRAGQLSLKKEVPSGLAQLSNPYDPAANSSYEVLDLSYYKGKLYLYHGVTPAVVFFWPYVAVTGHYLLQKDAVLIFSVVGFLASVGLLIAVWRRYFEEVGVYVVAAGGLALGLATCTLLLLARSDVWEVAVSCGYALTMIAIGAIWCALSKPEKRCRWLAAASLAYGLAVGARPNMLFGTLIVFGAVVTARREHQKLWVPLLAAAGPITLIGLGLTIYNELRFDSPFEFGNRYQLAAVQQLTTRFFSLRYLWFNFRVYFLGPVHWSSRFPFVHEIPLPSAPLGHMGGSQTVGVLTNVPLVWLALATPLAWRGRPLEFASALRRFVRILVILFGSSALTLCLFVATQGRYEVDFLPALVLLAVIGILSVERSLSDRPFWRHAARWCWSILLLFSVATNLLASVQCCAKSDFNLGVVLDRAGKAEDAIKQYEQALRLDPEYAEAHNNLGTALMKQDRREEAIGHYEQALRLKPDYGVAHINLGIALRQVGRVQEAISHYEQALRISPNSADAHYNLGNALVQAGRVQDAIKHWQQALQINPDLADTHYNLGIALETLGRIQEAIQQYEQVLHIKPDFAEAQNALVRVRAGQ
jgi:Flp pilus assembly protein TadD